MGREPPLILITKTKTMNIQSLILMQEEIDASIENINTNIDYTTNPDLINETIIKILNPLENISTALTILIDDINDGIYEGYEEDENDEEMDEWD
jgi:hypothetical protein